MAQSLPTGRWWLVLVGFGLLAIPPLLLFALGTAGTLEARPTWVPGLLLAGGTVAAAAGIRYEGWALIAGMRAGPPEWGQPARDLLSVGAGALLSFAGVVELGISPVVSAGAVGIAAAILVPTGAVAVYCGAFIGMTSPARFGTYWAAVAAAVLAAPLLSVARPVFHGVGGKLGTTAFVGVTATVLLTGGSFGSGPVPAPALVALVVALAVLAAVATYLLHTRTGASPVLASGAVGVVDGLLVAGLAGDTGALLGPAVFSASFAGMTSPKRVPTAWGIGAGGVGVGLLLVYTTPFLGGSGGKLGTIAFGACLGVHAVLRRVHLFRLSYRGYVPPRRDST